METIIKDITTVDKGIIIHQVNCMNAMGSGVALALFTKWPSVKSEYHAYCDGKKPEELLGDVQYVNINDNITVVNSFTQLTYGVPGKHTYEELLIANIKKIAEKHADVSVYIPYLIGCGLGGGDWATVEDGIKDIPNLIITKIPE